MNPLPLIFQSVYTRISDVEPFLYGLAPLLEFESALCYAVAYFVNLVKQFGSCVLQSVRLSLATVGHCVDDNVYSFGLKFYVYVGTSHYGVAVVVNYARLVATYVQVACTECLYF